MANNAETVSIWWHHHEVSNMCSSFHWISWVFLKKQTYFDNYEWYYLWTTSFDVVSRNINPIILVRYDVDKMAQSKGSRTWDILNDGSFVGKNAHIRNLPQIRKINMHIIRRISCTVFREISNHLWQWNGPLFVAQEILCKSVCKYWELAVDKWMHAAWYINILRRSDASNCVARKCSRGECRDHQLYIEYWCALQESMIVVKYCTVN